MFKILSYISSIILFELCEDIFLKADSIISFHLLKRGLLMLCNSWSELTSSSGSFYFFLMNKSLINASKLFKVFIIFLGVFLVLIISFETVLFTSPELLDSKFKSNNLSLVSVTQESIRRNNYTGGSISEWIRRDKRDAVLNLKSLPIIEFKLFSWLLERVYWWSVTGK